MHCGHAVEAERPMHEERKRIVAMLLRQRGRCMRNR